MQQLPRLKRMSKCAETLGAGTCIALEGHRCAALESKISVSLHSGYSIRGRDAPVKKSKCARVRDAGLVAKNVFFAAQNGRQGRQGFVQHPKDVSLRVASQPL